MSVAVQQETSAALPPAPQSSASPRFPLTLSTGVTQFVAFKRDGKGYQLLCYKAPSDPPTFTIPLAGCRFINNITEKGPCVYLISSAGEFEFQCASHEAAGRWNAAFVQAGCQQLQFTNLYRLTEFIGEGSFAKVYIASSVFTGEEVVVKAVEKGRVQESNVLSEIEVLRQLNHPYVIKLLAAYEQESHICLALEYLRGGELFEQIQAKGRYDEPTAREVMRRLLSALSCLHGQGIVHRDIKTENLILESEAKPHAVKLIDFGLAARVGTARMNMRCGSPGYVAPEILQERAYGPKVDVFSAGVIMYVLLAGHPPFRGADVRDILKKNLRCEVSYRGAVWSEVSWAAKDLIGRMLARDPVARCSADEALRHPWIATDAPAAAGSTPQLSPSADSCLLMMLQGGQRPSGGKPATHTTQLAAPPLSLPKSADWPVSPAGQPSLVQDPCGTRLSLGVPHSPLPAHASNSAAQSASTLRATPRDANTPDSIRSGSVAQETPLLPMPPAGPVHVNLRNPFGPISAVGGPGGLLSPLSFIAHNGLPLGAPPKPPRRHSGSSLQATLSPPPPHHSPQRSGSFFSAVSSPPVQPDAVAATAPRANAKAPGTSSPVAAMPPPTIRVLPLPIENRRFLLEPAADSPRPPVPASDATPSAAIAELTQRRADRLLRGLRTSVPLLASTKLQRRHRVPRSCGFESDPECCPLTLEARSPQVHLSPVTVSRRLANAAHCQPYGGGSTRRSQSDSRRASALLARVTFAGSPRSSAAPSPGSQRFDPTPCSGRSSRSTRTTKAVCFAVQAALAKADSSDESDASPSDRGADDTPFQRGAGVQQQPAWDRSKRRSTAPAGNAAMQEAARLAAAAASRRQVVLDANRQLELERAAAKGHVAASCEALVGGRSPGARQGRRLTFADSAANAAPASVRAANSSHHPGGVLKSALQHQQQQQASSSGENMGSAQTAVCRSGKRVSILAQTSAVVEDRSAVQRVQLSAPVTVTPPPPSTTSSSPAPRPSEGLTLPAPLAGSVSPSLASDRHPASSTSRASECGTHRSANANSAGFASRLLGLLGPPAAPQHTQRSPGGSRATSRAGTPGHRSPMAPTAVGRSELASCPPGTEADPPKAERGGPENGGWSGRFRANPFAAYLLGAAGRR